MLLRILPLCVALTAFVALATASQAASIQMLPPVQSGTASAPCTASAVGKLLSWDGANAISCQAGVIVDSAGNVGIGTTAPKTQLQVINGGGVGNIHIGGNGDTGVGATYSSLTLAAGVDGNWLTNSWVLAHKKTGPNAGGLGISKFAGGGLVVDAVSIAGSGNVGVGANAPASKLDVAGGVKIGADTATCVPAKAGTLRYNSSSNVIEYCTGSVWQPIGGTTGTYVDMYQCPGPVSLGGGKWGYYGCQNQITNTPTCYEVEYPTSQTFSCTYIGKMLLTP